LAHGNLLYGELEHAFSFSDAQWRTVLF